MDEGLIRDVCGAQARLRPLRIIEDPKGDIRHALKASDETFQSFGEAYFTSVVPGIVKGWKKHLRMQMHLVVAVGEVRFHVHAEGINQTKSVVLGPNNYQRLVVDPGLWMAFEGTSDEPNLILNLASIEHDPDEAANVPLSALPLA